MNNNKLFVDIGRFIAKQIDTISNRVEVVSDGLDHKVIGFNSYLGAMADNQQEFYVDFTTRLKAASDELYEKSKLITTLGAKVDDNNTRLDNSLVDTALRFKTLTDVTNSIDLTVSTNKINISSLESTILDVAAETATNITNLDTKLSTNLTNSVAALEQKISASKTRIDTILDGSSVDLDSFKETVDYIKQIDTENDNALQSYLISANKRFETAETNISTTASNLTDLKTVVANNKVEANVTFSNVKSSIATEKGRIDAILSASSADKDSFKEVVDFINSIDLENDNNLATFKTNTDNNLATQLNLINNRYSKAQTDDKYLSKDGIAKNAKKLETSRKISITGSGLSSNVSFDGSEDVIFNISMDANAHNHDNTYLKKADKAVDSDLFDGLDSSAFMKVSDDTTIKGNLTITDADPKLIFKSENQSSDNVTISTTSKGLEIYETSSPNNILFKLETTGLDSKAGFKWNGQSLDQRYLSINAKADDTTLFDGLNASQYVKKSDKNSLADTALSVDDDTITIHKGDGTAESVTISDYSLSSEQVQDIVGTMIENTGKGIIATYNDSTGKLNFDVNDPMITIDGDLSGSAVMTNLNNVVINATIKDDSHNHTIANIDGLQDALDNKAEAGVATTAFKLENSRLITIDGDLSGSVSFDGTTDVTINTTIKDDSHNHTIANIDGLQEALDSKTEAGVATSTFKLENSRLITLDGDLSGSVSFDGTTDVTINTTIKDDSHNHTIANIDGLQDALDNKLTAPNNVVSSNIEINQPTAGKTSLLVSHKSNDPDNTPAIIIATDGEKEDVIADFRANVDGTTVDTTHTDTSPDSKVKIMGDGSVYTKGEIYVNNNKVFHSGNDGVGSGLDADKLDGLDANQFFRKDTDLSLTTNIIMNAQHQIKFNSTVNNGSDWGFITYDNDNNSYAKWGDSGENSALRLGVTNDGATGTSDVIAFESPAGIFLNSPNIFQGTGNKIWHEGNDGSGSGLDADKLDGYELNQIQYHPITDGIKAKTVTGDWNDIIETGFYMGSSLKNESAGSSWRYCSVIHHNTLWIQQTMWDFSGTTMYQRNKVNGTWQSWKTFWHSGNDGAGSGLDADKLGGFSSSDFSRLGDYKNAVCNAGWVTIAESDGGRGFAEIFVWDTESGDHGFMHLNVMRSYADDTISILNAGGHARRITGARWIRTSDDTYGHKKLQVYVTTTSNYQVKIKDNNVIPGFSTTINTVTPLLENLPNGWYVSDGEITGLTDSGGYIATTGSMKIDGHNVLHDGNTGSGSGLDADKLDGLHATQFLRSDTPITVTSDITLKSKNPIINFNGISDSGIDMAIRATPEGLDFIEPEEHNKIHFQILDDAGVNSLYGYKWNGQSLDSRYAKKNANPVFDSGTNTTVTIKSNDDGVSTLRVIGDNQGTGVVEVGQSVTHGGGISYNGDSRPEFAGGESSDYISFYRNNYGSKSVVFDYAFSNDTVRFRATPTVKNGNSWTKVVTEQSLPTKLKTINGESIYGTGNIKVTANSHSYASTKTIGVYVHGSSSTYNGYTQEKLNSTACLNYPLHWLYTAGNSTNTTYKPDTQSPRFELEEKGKFDVMAAHYDLSDSRVNCDILFYDENNTYLGKFHYRKTANTWSRSSSYGETRFYDASNNLICDLPVNNWSGTSYGNGAFYTSIDLSVSNKIVIYPNTYSRNAYYFHQIKTFDYNHHLNLAKYVVLKPVEIRAGYYRSSPHFLVSNIFGGIWAVNRTK